MSATAQDIVALYRRFLQREPESEDVVSARVGRPLAEVALEFARSWEFNNLEQETRKANASRSYGAFLSDESAHEGSTDSTAPRASRHAQIASETKSLQRLYSMFFPESSLPEEWYEVLAAILRSHGAGILDLAAYFRAMLMHENGLSVSNQTVVDSLSVPLAGLKNFSSKVTLVVPTVTSAHWLDHLIDFYNDIGIKAMFVVDESTSEPILSLLAAKGAAYMDVGFIPRSGSLMGAILAHNDTDWVLRVDADELPTPAMLNFVDQAVECSPQFTWGFSSLYCRYNTAACQVEFSQFLPFGPLAAADLQWRLVSTHGANSHKQHRAARSDALILNFRWIVRSFLECLADLQRYEGSESFRDASLSHFQLYQAIPESWHMFAPLPNQRYNEVAKALHQSRMSAAAQNS